VGTRGDRIVAAVVAGSLALANGCASFLETRPRVPLVYPVNYRVIRGTVGRELTCGAQPPCATPKVLVPARIDEGDLPPGLTLADDGSVSGTPRETGEWHAMVRSARLQCDDKVQPDMWQTLHFEIADKSGAGAEER
jgi:hypothetical protein